jgi:hypothetical protein
MTRNRILFIVLLFGVVTVLLPLLPPFRVFPSRDSGFFLYMGEQWLAGKIPYLDIWDHKPPGIFFVDAAALWMGGSGLWGLWILECLNLLAAEIICYRLAKKYLAPECSIIWPIALLSCLPFVIIDGNLTEEFGMTFQFLAAWFFLGPKRSFRNMAGCGMAAAACFLFKPNLAGVGLVAVIGTLARINRIGWKPALTDLLAMGVGGAVVLLATLTPFISHHALPQTWDAVIRYNTAYTRSTLQDKINAAVAGSSLFSEHNKMLFLVMEIGVAVAVLGLIKKQPATSTANRLTKFCLVWLPVEIIFSTLSGRQYEHYFTPWLAPMSFLAAQGSCALANYIAEKNTCSWLRWFSRDRILGIVGLLIFIPALKTTIPQILHANPDPRLEEKAAASYIQQNTVSSDTVLVWGADVGINFFARRQSPSFYAYQYPLYTTNYVTPQMIARFLNDLEKNRPKLIIDISASDKFIPPIDLKKRREWRPVLVYYLPPDMNAVFSFIESHYQIIGTAGSKSWPVYQLVN